MAERMDPYEAVRQGRRVVAKYGGGAGTRAVGRVIGYCDAPQFLIEDDNGQRVWWRADMTSPAQPRPLAREGDRAAARHEED